jgi:hypothetical protein
MSTISARLVLILLLGTVVVFCACSYSVNYVVVNDSNERIQIQLVTKKLPNGRVDPDPPAELGLLNVSELDDHKPWRALQASLLTFDAVTRTVVITLMPQEALRVDQHWNVSCTDNSPSAADRFRVEEISITGAHGAIRLGGEQARRSFVSEARNMCTLTYR